MFITYPFRKIAYYSRYIYKRTRALPPFVALYNKTSQELFKKNPPSLSPTQKRIIAELERDGIAATHLDELFPKENMSRNLFNELLQYGDRKSAEMSTGRKKPFLEYVWGEGLVPADLSSPFFRLAVEPAVLDIANSYLNLFSKFVFSSYNITNPMADDAEAKGSQRWHRDPSSGDFRICKIFIYLSDVDNDSGPFQYMKQTHRSGKLSGIFPSHFYEGHYPQAGEPEKRIPSENFFSATGRAGSVIFCDTTGLHRGGYSRKKLRKMSTFFYVTPGSLQKPRFSYPKHFEELILNLPRASRLALAR